MRHRYAGGQTTRLPAAQILLVCVVFAVACGKKGPPLPPFVRLPAAVQQISATRLGSDIYLSLTLPSANVDRSTPVDLGYVDVYALTGMAVPPRATFVDQATRVARIPVASVPVAGESNPQPALDAPSPGAMVTLVDRTGEPGGAGLRRFYLAVPFSTRAQPGAQHTPAEVPFSAAPPAPPAPQLTVMAEGVSITWAVPTPPAVAAPAASPPAVAGTPTTAPAPSVMRINVYRESASEPAEAPPVWRATRPVPLNMTPLAAPPFSDPVPMGAEVCYVLRQAAGDGATATVGAPSPRVCVTPVDRFAPAAPSRVVATASAGVIDLLWEANTEADLAGYLVLRGAPSDATLRPLTQAPTTELRYSDTTVVPGMRYVYAVVAVDTQMPTPNVSAESARVEETAQ